MAIERVNLTFNGGQSSKEASGGAMSADGRYVVFISSDKDILGGPARGDEVYLRDMQTGETQLISKGYNGDTVGGMIGVGISGDGRYVVYGSNADNIVEGDDDGLGDVFVYDRQTGETRMLSDSAEHHTYFGGAVATDGSSVAYWEDRGRDDRIVARGLTNDTVYWDSDTETDWEGHTFNVWELTHVATGMVKPQPYGEGFFLNTRTTGYRNDSLYATNGYWTGPYGQMDAWNQQFSIGAGGNEAPPGRAGGAFNGRLLLYRSANYSSNAITYERNGAERVSSILITSKSEPGRLIRTESGALSDNGNTAFFASNFDFGSDKFIEGFAIFAWDTRTTSLDPKTNTSSTPEVRMLVHLKDATSNPFYNLRSSANGHYLTFITDAAVDASDTNGVADIYRVLNPLWDGAGGEEDPDPSEDWIMGTANDDVLLGTGKDDRIDALAGNDDVEGGQGDDEIYGREGDDKIWGGAGDDEIEGGDGDDVICGDYGDNAAGGGDDILSGGKGKDVIHGESGDDKLWGDDGDDVLYGEDGKDSLVGGDGNDKLYGGKGDDKLTGGKGADLIVGGDDPAKADIDIAIFEGSAGDYEIYDPLSRGSQGYEVKVRDKDASVVDTVIGVERAQFEHLATNQVDAQTALLTFAQAADRAYSQTADLGHGWRALSTLELGMSAEGDGKNAVYHYTYRNGFYSAIAEAPVGDEPIEAAAHVYFGVVDGKNTVMLAFRGTDSLSDGQDYPRFALHYAKFEPLIQAVLKYVENDGYNTGGDKIEQVMVTGHSLGGAMVQMFMQDQRVKGDSLYTAATFGSPGAEKNAPDARITHVEHTADLVPLSGDVARLLLGVGQVADEWSDILGEFEDNPVDFKTSGGVVRVSLQASSSPLAQHSMTNYLATAERMDASYGLLEKLGLNVSPGQHFDMAVGGLGDDEISGSNPLVAKLLRGSEYFDGSEVIVGGAGRDTMTGGAGHDVFAGFEDDMDFDRITDFAQGDVIKIFGYTGTGNLIYDDKHTDSAGYNELFFNTGSILLKGWNPGTFRITVDAERTATITYEGLFNFTGGDEAEDFGGGDGDDLLNGGGGDDNISGGGGDDRIAGGSGSDKLAGGAGNDSLFGGEDPDASLQPGGRSAAPAERGLAAPAEEIDTAVYEGLRSQYRAEIDEDGVVTITDLRSGSPEGVDTLHDFEAFQFADKTYTLADLMNPPPPTGGGGGGGGGGGDPQPNPGQNPGSQGGWSPTQVVSMFENAALGVAPDAATSRLLQSLAEQTLAGTLSQEAAKRQIIDLQDATTAVALQTYQFFTGATPSYVGGGLAYLVNSPVNDHDLNDAYFAAFNQESRYINFSVNLALDSSSAGLFGQTWGKLSNAQVIDKAYDMVIGDAAATSAGVDLAAAQAYIGRAENIDFLTRLAGSRSDADLFVKAALVGQILSIGTSTTFGAYSQAASGYIADLMDGDLTWDQPVDLVGAYGPQAQLGLT